MPRWRRYAAPGAFLLVVTIGVLLIRPALRDDGPTQKPSPTTEVRPRAYYRVRAGDTFSSIAATHGLTVAKLERLNPGVSSTSLFIGQRIRVG